MKKVLIVTAEGARIVEIEDMAYEKPREELIAEIQAVIDSLKAQIAEGDYKVIKCAEAQLIGEEVPYNVAELHEQRQALRDKINKIEVELERM